MKKLHLELDELAVESFETSRGAGGERGTVRGHFRAVGDTRYLWECGEVSWDAAGCFTGDLDCFTVEGADTCRPNFTCPECAAP